MQQTKIHMHTGRLFSRHVPSAVVPAAPGYLREFHLRIVFHCVRFYHAQKHAKETNVTINATRACKQQKYTQMILMKFVVA